MYSERIRSLLEQKTISLGTRITVTKQGKIYEGLLLPKAEGENPDALVVKLDSGYNVGLLVDDSTTIEKSTTSEPKNIQEEGDLELGKVSKKNLSVEFDPSKPPISLIVVGGTIASRVDYTTGGVAALEDPREFLHNIPELGNIVNIPTIERPFTKMSEDMDPQDWIDLAQAVYKELENDNTKGILITQGTDTLHYTAAALSFFIRNLNKPIILTGAQKSSDRPSADTGINMICSAHATLSDIAEVAICAHAEMHDSFCHLIRGTKARKMHTSRRDAFRAINELPLAHIYPDGTVKTQNTYTKRNEKQSPLLDASFEHNTTLLKVFPGSDPDVLNYHVSKGCKGFVIEGTGLGHVPTQARKSWIESVKKLTAESIPVVIAPQTIYGRVNPHVYSNLRTLYTDAGAIPGEDMTPETAYVKLGWVLAHTQELAEIKTMMAKNYAGEIQQRIPPEAFLL